MDAMMDTLEEHGHPPVSVDGAKTFGDDDDRWAAVVARDRSADGTFVFGVRTTGIYCRPSCPARKPKRENVTFLASPEAAEAAGFRACKRCHPKRPASDGVEAEVVAAATRLIDQAIGLGEPEPSLDRLAERAGYSKFHFHRMFKATLGVTPKAYAAAARARAVAEALGRGDSVTDALHGAGYGSSSRFYESGADRIGMAPSTARKGGVGETIGYGFGASSLGRVLVARTELGVCAIQIGDTDADLIDELRSRFPKARLIADPGYADLVARVVSLVERPGRTLDLPLDVRGTAFQELVWRALRSIPAGDTATYAQVAREIGHPGAARGVARACASNPVAVAIPCHRVVRSDGALAGYRWGVDRKAELLDRERTEAREDPAAP